MTEHLILIVKTKFYNTHKSSKIILFVAPKKM